MSFAAPFSVPRSGQNTAVSTTKKEAEEESKREITPEEYDFNYTPPSWSSAPKNNTIYFEVLKNGVIIDKIRLPQDVEFLLFGRLSSCDIVLEHASTSRRHAVLQFGNGSVYLYDLDSSHGTFVNKQKIPAKKYVELCEGFLFNFGESTRQYILSYESVIDGKDLNTLPEKVDFIANSDPSVLFLRNWLAGFDKELLFNYKDTGPDKDTVMVHFDMPAINQNLRSDPIHIETSAATREAAEAKICEKVMERLIERKLISTNDLKTYKDTKENTEEWKMLKRQKAEEREDETDVLFDQTRNFAATNYPLIAKVETEVSLNNKRADLISTIKDLWEQIHQITKDEPEEEAKSGDELDTYMEGLKTTFASEEEQRIRKEIERRSTELTKIESILIKIDKSAPNNTGKAVRTNEKTMIAKTRATVETNKSLPMDTKKEIRRSGFDTDDRLYSKKRELDSEEFNDLHPDVEEDDTKIEELKKLYKY